jgi:hypothetical protein
LQCCILSSGEALCMYIPCPCYTSPFSQPIVQSLNHAATQLKLTNYVPVTFNNLKLQAYRSEMTFKK